MELPPGGLLKRSRSPLGSLESFRDDSRTRSTNTPSERLLRRHQFSDSRFKDLVLAFVALCNRLIVFIRRETDHTVMAEDSFVALAGDRCFFCYADVVQLVAVSGITSGTFSGLRFGALFMDCCTSSTYLNFARDFIRRNWLWLIPIAARISSSDWPSR
jgi:hypothetical protein